MLSGFPYQVFDHRMSQTSNDLMQFKSIEEYSSLDAALFDQIQAKNLPALLKNCNFGECMARWDLDYLTDNLKDESIVIHESDSSKLNFLNKNFRYRTCSFLEFSQILQNNNSDNHVYLRSINRNPRAKKAARIEIDFPSISNDLKPPEYIPFGHESKLYHSSVLRIASSKVQIWTHFDLYDNVLCQIIGTKRVIMFSPEDSKYLYIKGDKSLVNDFDNLQECCQQYPLVKDARPYKCILNPGDTLYLPALWWHNIKTISEYSHHCDKNLTYSIGFNIFWRDQILHMKSLYAETDVYGNKNLPAFDSALANLDKAICHLEKLPEKYKTLYKCMLLEHFKSKLFPDNHKLK